MNVRSIAAAAAVFAMMPSLAPHAMGAPAEDLRSDAAAGLSVGHEAQARIPVLVVTSGHRPISRYYGEILQAEGLNLFSTVDISRLTAETLERADLLVLAEVPVSAEQAELIGRWVESGGRLIAMRPDPDLAPLLGLEQEDRPVRDGYLLAEISSAAGRGIAQSTLQIHGEADRYRLTDGTVVAHLFADATSALPNPAVTLRSIGQNGGQAASFVYDLATSIVLTRQGNPDWAGEERDGFSPYRANDLFYPDFVDLDRVAIPQADEQQRLFANLIVTMLQSKLPLPRFWYLPYANKAAIVMASDDHRTGTGQRYSGLLAWISGRPEIAYEPDRPGTVQIFDKLIAESPPGCSVARWECFRATSYLQIGTPLSAEQAMSYEALGFELGVHVDTGCADTGPELYRKTFGQQFLDFAQAYPGLARQTTHRLHCIAWLGWTEAAEIAREYGIRLDLNYYYWPPSWIRDRPGFFTGSGLPMRLVDRTGRILDVYQVVTQLTNENGMTQPAAIEAMLDRALGPEGFFGTFGTHYDFTDRFADHLVRAAKERGVPLISARQLLTWLDGRNGSSFSDIAWDGSTLSFDVAAGADGLYAMLPGRAAAGNLTTITCNARKVEHSFRMVKGLDYALFPVRSGTCAARYRAAP